MKLKTVSVVKFESLLSKGDIVRITDGMDSNNGIYRVEGMDQFNLVTSNIKTGRQLLIKASESDRYDFEVGSMQFVSSAKEPDKTKEECNKTESEYSKQIHEELKTLRDNLRARGFDVVY